MHFHLFSQCRCIVDGYWQPGISGVAMASVKTAQRKSESRATRTRNLRSE